MSGEPAWKMRLLDRAKHDLAATARPIAQRVAGRLRWLVTNADAIQHRGLRGDVAGYCKLRVGDWRVIYELVTDERLILVHAVGHRSRIYHDLPAQVGR